MQEPGEGPQERAIPVFQPRDDDKEIYGEDLGEQFKTFQVPDQMVSANFQPVTREVDEIFKEDEENADKYANICEEDDKIYVEGLPGELALIDTWEDAMLPETLMTNIKRCNYVKPRQIQRAAVPKDFNDFKYINAHFERMRYNEAITESRAILRKSLKLLTDGTRLALSSSALSKRNDSKLMMSLHRTETRMIQLAKFYTFPKKSKYFGHLCKGFASKFQLTLQCNHSFDEPANNVALFESDRFISTKELKSFDIECCQCKQKEEEEAEPVIECCEDEDAETVKMSYHNCVSFKSPMSSAFDFSRDDVLLFKKQWQESMGIYE